MVACGPAGPRRRPGPTVWPGSRASRSPCRKGPVKLALEATSQMLRPDLERSADGRSFARLDGEEWQLTGDWAMKAGLLPVQCPGPLGLPLRRHRRSGHLELASDVQHAPGGTGGCAEEPAVYYLERDGHVIGDLTRPGVTLMDLDVAWIRPFGTADAGGADRRLGAAAHREAVRFFRQRRHRWAGGRRGLEAARPLQGFRPGGAGDAGPARHSPLREVMDRTSFNRAWGSVAWLGQGPGSWTGSASRSAWLHRQPLPHGPRAPGPGRLAAALDPPPHPPAPLALRRQRGGRHLHRPGYHGLRGLPLRGSLILR